jgi:hypothetical protein
MVKFLYPRHLNLFYTYHTCLVDNHLTYILISIHPSRYCSPIIFSLVSSSSGYLSDLPSSGLDSHTGLSNSLLKFKIHVHLETECSQFGNKFFETYLISKVRSHRVRMGTRFNMTSALIRREKFGHTRKRRLCEGGGRDWSDASTKECQDC